MDESKIRAWHAYRQGLDGSLAGKSAAEVLGRTGWARSVGGVGPYLTLFSRAGLSRASVDDSVAKLEIHELPSARTCTYVLPASDFALGLKIGLALGDGEMKVAAKLGVTAKEIDKLCEAGVARAGEGAARHRRAARIGRKSGAQFGRGGQEKGIGHDAPRRARKAPVVGRHPAHSTEWPAGSAALQIHALASESAARFQTVRR